MTKKIYVNIQNNDQQDSIRRQYFLLREAKLSNTEGAFHMKSKKSIDSRYCESSSVNKNYALYW